MVINFDGDDSEDESGGDFSITDTGGSNGNEGSDDSGEPTNNPRNNTGRLIKGAVVAYLLYKGAQEADLI